MGGVGPNSIIFHTYLDGVSLSPFAAGAIVAMTTIGMEVEIYSVKTERVNFGTNTAFAPVVSLVAAS